MWLKFSCLDFCLCPLKIFHRNKSFHVVSLFDCISVLVSRWRLSIHRHLLQVVSLDRTLSQCLLIQPPLARRLQLLERLYFSMVARSNMVWTRILLALTLTQWGALRGCHLARAPDHQVQEIQVHVDDPSSTAKTEMVRAVENAMARLLALDSDSPRASNHCISTRPSWQHRSSK